MLIEEGGYGAASVLAIAERARVASGTPYRHFASKEELFVEVFRAVCAREERAMGAVRAPDERDGAGEWLQTVLTTFARRALANLAADVALIAEPADPRVDSERLAYRALRESDRRRGAGGYRRGRSRPGTSR